MDTDNVVATFLVFGQCLIKCEIQNELVYFNTWQIPCKWSWGLWGSRRWANGNYADEIVIKFCANMQAHFRGTIDTVL